MEIKWEWNFHILPDHISTLQESSLDKVCHNLHFWEGDGDGDGDVDVTFPGTLKAEINAWFLRWCGSMSENIPANLLKALKECDSDVYPCIH